MLRSENCVKKQVTLWIKWSTQPLSWSLILVRCNFLITAMIPIYIHKGMTTANLKLATVSVLMEDKLETPKQHLEAGEFIVVRVVALKDLEAELKGK